MSFSFLLFFLGGGGGGGGAFCLTITINFYAMDVDFCVTKNKKQKQIENRKFDDVAAFLLALSLPVGAGCRFPNCLHGVLIG